MKIVRSNDAAWAPALTRGKYENRRKELGTGKLASSIWELPAGRKSFPMHRHLVTEEAFFVLSGRAKVRTPDGETEVSAGDWVSLPAGGAAHQLVNGGTEPFVYLAVSTNPAGVDVVEYPESRKMATSVGSWPSSQRWLFKPDGQPDYFEGDPDAG